jgi:hypothetical protein
MNRPGRPQIRHASRTDGCTAGRHGLKIAADLDIGPATAALQPDDAG